MQCDIQHGGRSSVERDPLKQSSLAYEVICIMLNDSSSVPIMKPVIDVRAASKKRKLCLSSLPGWCI